MTTWDELRGRFRIYRHASKRELIRGRRVFAVGGCTLEVPAERAWAYAGGAYYEKNVLHWLTRAATAIGSPVFYDVGANCGQYTIALASLARTVYAFEPIADTYQFLERNVTRNRLSNVRSFQIALGDTSGSATFFLYSSRGLSSSVARDEKPAAEEQVEVTTIDELVADNKIEPPDLIKIDTEGTELFVLRGARRTLQDSAPILLLEFAPERAQAAGYDFADVRAELSRYSIFGLSDPFTADAADTTLYPVDGAPDNVGNLVAIPSNREL